MDLIPHKFTSFLPISNRKFLQTTMQLLFLQEIRNFWFPFFTIFLDLLKKKTVLPYNIILFDFHKPFVLI
jgi:hypothetical protein